MSSQRKVIRKLRGQVAVEIDSSMIDQFLQREKTGRHIYDVNIEPFTEAKNMNAFLGAVNPSGGDLRFLCLFPNLTKLSIVYHDRGNVVGDGELEERLVEPRPFRLEGIENCPWLEILDIMELSSPIIMNGIEYCQNIHTIIMETYCYEGGSIDINPISNLPSLKSLRIDIDIPVDTRNLCLSGCTSLKELQICPISRNLRFLEGVEIEELSVRRGKLQTLKGLNTSCLEKLDARDNKIRSLKTLRNAGRLTDLHIDGNPIDDKKQLREILQTVNRRGQGNEW